MEVHIEDPSLLVEDVMDDEDKERLTGRVVAMNPRLQGAKVADMIDMYVETDSYCGEYEQWVSRHGGALGHVPGPVRHVCWMAAYLSRKTPGMVGVKTVAFALRVMQKIEESSEIRRVIVTWDTDGEKVDHLPGEANVPIEVRDEDVADWLSDRFGWCVEGWSLADA